jgi:hypothetical protein
MAFPEQGLFNHLTGRGWVEKCLGDYEDAPSRRTRVCLALVEMLNLWGRSTTPPNCNYTLCPNVLWGLRQWIVRDMAVILQVLGRSCSIIHSVSHVQL